MGIPSDKVLLLLSKKKLDRMCPMGVYDSTDQCEFVCIDPTCDIPTQVAGFETTTILHKITDWAESNPEVIEAARELTNPTPCSVDSQLACTDRWDLQQAFIAAGVNVPRMYLIEPSANEMPRLNYPQILKTRVACGTVASHHMAVVSSAKELEEFRREHREDAVCAQDFIPHGGIIYKVFVIGGEVRLDIRPSLGDDAVGKSFDSQNMKGIVVQQKPSVDPSGVDINKVKDIALKVDGKLGLGLFGLDLIVGSRDQKYYVVDVNYFPTFKGVDGLPKLIRQLLLHQQQQ
ncbi:conserved hypothetical protein [Perkinsus marinus ATCC 50983]|uniref:ATP-grasp domain-containing protein n=1 Tax=Perkinsus marinus (strain ATCC 50983 / TXsc) TaxID=423536 RepID=C5LNM5_PERM5|nr:conserved hypothetical protein [Perkinsus marinus ATCC 50983]EER01644.1 conserved hypothetical protein [Perkinsus marinus ATCC 50983]|eukprot:XP_002768926.1 conserved hypothetical protein [Perkinsus marinus ATCC 50983]